MRILANGGAIPQLGVGSKAGSRAIVGAIGFAFAMLALALASHAYLNFPGPKVMPFVPIAAALWTFADLMTAFLLLSQFYVAGNVSFAIIAASYAVTGLLTVPYLWAFPGMFSSGPYSSGDLQVSAWIWVVWHLFFPIAIAVVHCLDGTLEKNRVSRDAIARRLAMTVGIIFMTTISVAAAIYLSRAWLPIIIMKHARFSTLYTSILMPLVLVVNALSTVTIFIRGRRLSPLQVGLAIALITMMLDAMLNAWAPARYTMVWYVGKLYAVLSSMIVLAMLLQQVAILYRRLYDVASLDSLTGLPNRRAFNERVGNVVGNREGGGDFALLVADIDFFKAFNDRYGHAAGDEALAAVADAIKGSLLRSSDFVARMGGEEFVVFLPDVTLDGAKIVAEFARNQVAKLAIRHEGSETGYLTVSIGGAHCRSGHHVATSGLFATADEALYAAKSRGRNCVEVCRAEEPEHRRFVAVPAR
jgi:diguanylate cyclase (GGDEF)-like protein